MASGTEAAPKKHEHPIRKKRVTFLYFKGGRGLRNTAGGAYALPTHGSRMRRQKSHTPAYQLRRCSELVANTFIITRVVVHIILIVQLACKVDTVSLSAHNAHATAPVDEKALVPWVQYSICTDIAIGHVFTFHLRPCAGASPQRHT